MYIYIYTYCNKKSWVWKFPLFSRFFIPKSKKQGTSCGSGTAAKKETQETANLSPREKCRSHLDGFVRSTSFKALPDVTCFVDSHSRMKNQPRVWGRVVWIAGIPENEMDCYLRKSESQGPKPIITVIISWKRHAPFQGGNFPVEDFLVR